MTVIKLCCDYLIKIEQRKGKTFEPQPYIRTQTGALKYRTGSKGISADYIAREGVFKHMWINVSLTDILTEENSMSPKRIERLLLCY